MTANIQYNANGYVVLFNTKTGKKVFATANIFELLNYLAKNNVTVTGVVR